MKAVKCPVCNGSGKYQVPNSASTAGPEMVKCHGCDGKGWVTVPDDGMTPFYPAPLPYPYPTYPTPWPWHPNEPIITYTTCRCDSGGQSSGSAKA